MPTFQYRRYILKKLKKRPNLKNRLKIGCRYVYCTDGKDVFTTLFSSSFLEKNVLQNILLTCYTFFSCREINGKVASTIAEEKNISGEAFQKDTIQRQVFVHFQKQCSVSKEHRNRNILALQKYRLNFVMRLIRSCVNSLWPPCFKRLFCHKYFFRHHSGCYLNMLLRGSPSTENVRSI